MDSKTNQKIVYGAGEGYCSTGAAAGCKAGPAASSSSNCSHPRVGRQAPGRVHASGEGDTRTGGSRRGSEEPDVMTIGPGPSWGGTRRRRGGGGGWGPEIRLRNVVVFFLFGRCERARQAVVPQDYRARRRYHLRRQRLRRKHGTPHAAGRRVRGGLGLRVVAGSR